MWYDIFEDSITGREVTDRLRRKATVSKEKTAEETRQKAAKMTQKKTAQKKAPQQKKNEGKKTAGKRTGAGSRKLKIIPLGGIGEVGKKMRT